MSGFGGPEVLTLRDEAVPVPRPDQVLIRVAAAGVNRADVLQRRGLYPPPADAPAWPGLEVSGVIDTVGEAVVGWHEGDEVCALLPGGGYAEWAAVDASLLLAAPAGISLVDAAALPEAACTVWSNLEAARWQPGETLLVHGGAGGIGTLAVQYAAARGMRVLATAGSADKVRRCLELGADAAVDYGDGTWPDAVRELTGGHGVDIVLDVVGGAYLAANVASLALGGRLVVIGLQRGARGEVDLGALLAKRASIIGTTLRSRPLAERAAIVAGVRHDVWPLVPDRVRPVVHGRYPLGEAAAAHRALEAGEVMGKLLLLT